MGTPHNEAKKGDFAKTVLMPGEEAPRLMKSSASCKLAMPPAALIFTLGPTCLANRATSCLLYTSALGLGWSWLPCLLVAMAGGAVLGAISGVLKSYCNVNEVSSILVR